mmetsp:Transcript_131601/g.281397  ORF Transcript_131601/g.281397 Transcript_131601/m.281397 type:complete len:518 (+) Transcript_131601:91-1644(+)
MGAGMSASLLQVLPADKWEKLGRGSRLRLLFAAYGVQDIWAVQRNLKQLDDGQGYVNYEELQQIVKLSDFSMLFVWDLFSQQNELMDNREFLTMICIFSSAKLPEKARFLLALFDESQSGRCTCMEVSQMCAMVLKVVSQCTGVVIKQKEVAKAFKAELPGLLQAYKKAMEQFGARMAFEAERLVSHSEIDILAGSIQASYETWPLAQLPPEGAERPPPLDKASMPVKASSRPPPKKEGAAPAASAKGQLHRAASAVQASAWLSQEAGLPVRPVEVVAVEPGPPHSWVVMHGGDFAEVAKDMPGFKRTFAKSVATALRLPAGCVDVINVVHGSIIVEFVVTSADEREHPELVELLAQQFGTAFSTLRSKKSPLAPFLAGGATLLEKPPYGYGGAPGMADGRGGGMTGPALVDMETDTADLDGIEALGTPRIRAAVPLEDEATTDLEVQLREALAQLDAARAEQEEAEAAERAALEELAQKDAVIADLKTGRVKSRWNTVGVLAKSGTATSICEGPMD